MSNINVNEQIPYISLIDEARYFKYGITVNLVVEHNVTTPTGSATKFTVLIFAVFDV